ncbi:odorant receptor 30a [Orussus abietinus]|uniref:odorant receptor 30a n=1 Tax=Orussus abietinus TaxID=222816 RepID=UPI00062692A8|nr:odorant receptor 30a [Orussus abietinus]
MIAKNERNAHMTFEDFFGPNVTMLRCTVMPFMNCAFFGKRQMLGILETIFSALSITGLCLVMVLKLQTLMSLWQQDTVYALSTVPALLSIILNVSKGIRFIQKRGELRDLLQKMALLWNTLINTNISMNIVHEMFQALIICRTVYFALIVGCVIFYSVPVYANISIQYFLTKNENNSYNYTQTIFSVVYPFPTRNAFAYFTVITMEQVIALLAATMWASCDTLFAHATTYAAIHFRILRHELENAFNNDSKPRPNDISNLKIVLLVDRHLELFRLCNAIENIFGPVVMLSMLLCATNMCICMYQIEKMLILGDYVEVAMNVTHLIALFLMTMTFCGYATMLSDQSEKVSLGVYRSNWFECDPIMKIFLMFIMRRSQKPFHCTAYGFFPLSLNQVTTIFSTALSYFSILRRMT